MKLLLDTHTFIWFVYNAPELPVHHKDPFDRLLIAQSQIENVAVVSIDAAFDSYGVNRIWLT